MDFFFPFKYVIVSIVAILTFLALSALVVTIVMIVVDLVSSICGVLFLITDDEKTIDDIESYITIKKQKIVYCFGKIRSVVRMKKKIDNSLDDLDDCK